MSKKFIEKELLLSDKKVFGDEEEHSYICSCHDGYAICFPESVTDGTEPLILTYPTLNEVLSDEATCDEILEYCGLYDLTEKDINVGDIALTYGIIHKFSNKEKKLLNTILNKKYQKIEVNWDTDGDDPKDLGLPEIVNVPLDVEEDDIADWLSDNYGYCVNSFGFFTKVSKKH